MAGVGWEVVHGISRAEKTAILQTLRGFGPLRELSCSHRPPAVLRQPQQPAVQGIQPKGSDHTDCIETC